MADVLVLGGTAWLGGEVARAALAEGHAVTCLARGESGGVPDGARPVVGDRRTVDGYAGVADRDWDAVVDVARQPVHVRTALDVLAPRVGHWTFVSSCSVYADQSVVGADESAALLPAAEGDVVPDDEYGGGKVACERLVVDAFDDAALLARAGLIVGPGDPTDRFGYWVSRFALAGPGPVVVSQVLDQPAQVVDVRDLASWLVRAASGGLGGAVDAVGVATTLGEVLARSAAVGGHTGDVVPLAPDRLAALGVQPWAGDRSMPLWLPDDFAGMTGRTAARAASLGLACRPLDETLVDTLAWEREQGLDRPRSAGLSRADEVALLP